MNYNEIRRKTREIKIGNIAIGGNNPIAIQSMTNTDTRDREATLAQIRKLEAAGCDIVRITVPDLEAAETIPYLKDNGVSIPIVADIHFDYRVALRCAEVGVDKIRINPGNIGDDERVRAVCNICNEKNIPIRIGVNSGSLEKEILAKYGAPTPEALCESALYHSALLEKYGFFNTVISIKASNPYNMILANRLLAEKCDYPLHLGVTEAGTFLSGAVKSAIGIGSLLKDNIGDTIRVSLTDDPTEEIYVAKEILNALDLRKTGARLVSCPTCGRTKLDLIGLAKRVDALIKDIEMPITVAVMGCVVNGPGEAREADIGIAGGNGEGLIFKKGEIIKKVKEEELFDALKCELEKLQGR